MRPIDPRRFLRRALQLAVACCLLGLTLWLVISLLTSDAPEPPSAEAPRPDHSPAEALRDAAQYEHAVPDGGEDSPPATPPDQGVDLPADESPDARAGAPSGGPPRHPDPMRDLAEHLARSHAAGRTVTAQELAALHGLEHYADPNTPEDAANAPGVGLPAFVLRLGYLASAQGFVDALVHAGRRHAPVAERDLAASETVHATSTDPAGDASPDAHVAALLRHVAAMASRLAACPEGEASHSDQPPGEDCRFGMAFMRGLAGDPQRAATLAREASSLLKDMENRLERRAAHLQNPDPAGGSS